MDALKEAAGFLVASAMVVGTIALLGWLDGLMMRRHVEKVRRRREARRAARR